MYSQKDITATKSSKWVPEGYFSRTDRDDAYWQRRTSILDEAKYTPGGAHALDQSEKSVDEKRDDSPATHSEKVINNRV